MSAAPRPLPAPPTSSRSYASPPSSPLPAHPHSPALSSTGAATALIPASAVAVAGEAIVCNGELLLGVYARGKAEAVGAGCKLRLEETSDSVVVSFGSSLWHVDW